MSAQPQLALDLAPDTPTFGHAEGRGLSPQQYGLSLDHHALFDGLTSEWLEPPASQGGHLLVRGGHPRPAEAPAAQSVRPAHLIVVRARVELGADPHHRVWALRAGEWVEIRASELEAQDLALWWPGPLSTHALVSLEVSSDEERARLMGLARQVSNLSLLPVEVSAPEFVAEPSLPAPVTDPAPGLSASYDRTRGAAAMGWWALPRTPPWFALLVSSFNRDDAAFAEAVEAVEAPWLRELPWRPRKVEAPTHDDVDAALWSAACQVMQTWPERASTKLAAKIAEVAVAAAPALGEELLAWSKQTRAILRAERDLDEDMRQPVAAALQLVLARSTPDRYKTWAKDHQDLPPAVWWTGALLCGLLRGYRELPSSFRGEPRLRELLARRLLVAPDVNVGAVPLRWSYAAGDVVQFQAGEELLARQTRTARGLWYSARLDDAATHAAALALVERLGWPCTSPSLVLRDEQLSASGAGQLELEGGRLRVRGELRLHLPAGVTLEDAVDAEAFKRALVTRGGELRQPPPQPSSHHYSAPELAASRAREASPPLPLAPRSAYADAQIPGLIYVPDFLTASESAALVEHIDGEPWLRDLSRRVQHYGWKYDYRARDISRDMHLGSLPEWAHEIAARMLERGLLPWLADQVIVNEYVEKQGISKHIDCVPCFEEDIAMLSLVEAWDMRFRPRESKERVDRTLAVGSVAIMTGPARYEWTHEIPRRKKEGKRVRKRRLSLTFRKVRGAM